MIRENYGNISGSSESGSSGSSSSGLNEQQVISLINSQTVQNFTNNFSGSDFNSFTNLNNWVNNKVNTIIENPVEEVYNRIKSDLYDKQITHTPINNICFTVNGSGSLSKRHLSFNTNSLVFEAMVTKAYNEGIQVKRGDVLVVFYKSQFGSNYSETSSSGAYAINNMMIIIGGYNMTASGVKLSVPFNSSGNVTYFRANPFTAYYSDPLISVSMTYNTSIELRTNAKCMSSSLTDIINLNFDPTKINYYLLWSGSNNPSDTSYIDFSNVFKTDVTTYNLMLSKAGNIDTFDPSQLSTENDVRLGFNAIGLRNSIQNEVVNMFNDTNTLNDFRKVLNLFQTYSLQSIYTTDDSICCPLHFNTSGTVQNAKHVAGTGGSEVYVMFIKDYNRNIMGIDLVYCPTGKNIRIPSSALPDSVAYFNPCNNIFNTCNDLTLTFNGAVNLNRNLSFTINFMNIRDSEYSTHLILYSKRLSFSNLLNQLDRNVNVASYLAINLNALNTNCYYLNLDDYIDQKQGSIMNTYESDNIRISFDKLI